LTHNHCRFLRKNGEKKQHILGWPPHDLMLKISVPFLITVHFIWLIPALSNKAHTD